ncbi:MAG TPA: PilC/PilY family type IV pilus protein [Thermoanaerobaculia bacterium]|jgi:Tfp pilus tip-associated adhesin PilY1|nr:PilC/PilY family type IV pilus protein [Thermoanaerobaculia bacterium]
MSPRDWCIGRTAIVRIFVRAAAALALLALLGPAAARGDDRDLLRTTIADPYLFILLDTSGSMNWSPKSVACPTGECFVPMQADDPTSKFYQAKEALYEVLTDPGLPKVALGFATYNQDQLTAVQKHWLYEAAADGVLLTGSTYFPAAGAREVFGNGTPWICDTGSNDHEIGCAAGTPADLNDIWELTRVRRLPKGGRVFAAANVQTFYIRTAGITYKVTYTPNGGSYGGNINVKVTVLKCNNGSCSNTTAVGTSTTNYTVVGDFVSWDNAPTANPDRNDPTISYYTSVSIDATVNNNTSSSCGGWDPNTDSASDKNSSNYTLRWPTDSSDPRGASFSLGDVIPLDWKTDHKIDILKRLAPNYVDSSTVPDFRIAPYLADNRSGSETFLRLKSENQRPLIAGGATPIGASVQQFRTWYSGCSADTCGTLGGWAGIAGAQDTSFQCRQKFLLILTDGDETCGGDPCKYTRLLRDQYGVTTFVVAFGVTATQGNALSCMADADHIFYPQTKDELVADLKTALGKIKEQASTFASAAVPSVQAEIADRIYLSNFTPLNDAAVWDGHLDGYLKPLPLKDGKPDRTRVCPALGSAGRSTCHLWDAGESILTQAPEPADVASTVDVNTLRLGTGTNQRRVFYTREVASGTVPSTLRLFVPPTGDPKTNPTPDWNDLLKGFKLTLPATAADSTLVKQRVTAIIKETLVVKSSTISVTGLPDRNIKYVLGDIFHADPVLIDRPNNFGFYTANLYANTSTGCSSNPGYQCYAQQQRRRRKMLLAAANDGQLHAFDAGVWDNGAKSFTDGTGKEIFSYIPRLALPVVRSQVEGGREIFGVDGTPRVQDVFLDPNHNGTPNAGEREWRTVAIGGFREGGAIDGGGRVGDFISGYYALDLTHPDQLDSANNPTQQTVPSCLSTTNGTNSGCGTLPFPAVLWEYTDSIASSQLDEDKNGLADLGQTWSVPIIGRIKVIEAGAMVDKFVAIFGGGMDADNKLSPKRGNWIYMVDVETGKTIYKRKVVGAAAADPAVLDTDLDGYLDTIYMGTTAGFVYKIDISSPGTLQNVSLVTTQAVPPLAAAATVQRITDTSWDPFAIFDTLGRPIYLAPSILYVSKLGRFALAFGTGDRENLWNLDGQVGRYYLILDDNFTSGGLPKTEANYEAINVTAANVSSSTNFLLNPNLGKSKGWFLKLQADERVITSSFGLSGIIIFSGFQPQEIGTDPAAVCARGGSSHIYVVYTNNGNGVVQTGSTSTRYRVVSTFVTSPYVEQGATKNPPTGTGGSGGTGGTGGSGGSGGLDLTQQQIIDQVKQLMPSRCKFGNQWISINGSGSDTIQQRYGSVPICVIEQNFKEW